MWTSAVVPHSLQALACVCVLRDVFLFTVVVKSG